MATTAGLSHLGFEPSPPRLMVRLPLLVLLLTLAPTTSAQSIVGSWEAVSLVDADGDPMPAIADILGFTFTASGQMIPRLSLRASKRPVRGPKAVPYRVEGSTITFTFNGVDDTVTFWFEEGGLYIQDDGDDSVMHLRPASP